MTMTGGDGADTFVFNLDYLKGRHSTATITDFDPKVDKLELLNDQYVKISSPPRWNTAASRQRHHRLAGRKAE
jgi:Ca2+-binding RTX toxin-like protein